MKFKECNSPDDFISFLDNDEQALRHTNYYHYTSLENVDKILDLKSIRLTSLEKSANDNIEKEKYSKFDGNLFSLCFSTGTSESLPLWYLYSGIDGCGGRIGFKKKDFVWLWKSAAFSLAEVQQKYPYDTIGEPIKLRDTDYKVTCRDILYIGNDSVKPGIYRAKYNGQVINGIKKDTYDSVNEKYYLFIKNLIWFYEKETRLQVEITNNDLLKSNKNYVVIIDISNVFEDLSVRLAPEFGEITTDLFDKYNGIKSWTFSKLQRSEFAGQLKMGLKEKLCRSCTGIADVNLNATNAKTR